MRILFYNWVDNHDPEKRGGGVALYQRNVLAELEGRADVTATFLSSGISYDLFDARPRWARVAHGTDRTGERYEIVNSGVLAPAHHSFGHDAQIDHPPTTAAFLDFLEKTGPYDIVHFNNLEGLPATVLTLKARFPQTRVIYMLHNYYPVCPQVNLWHQERENCLDYAHGEKCVGCLPHRPDAMVVRQANAVAFNFKRRGIQPGERRFDRMFGPGVRVTHKALRVGSRWSRSFREVRGMFQYELAHETPAASLTRVEPPGRKFRRRREQVVEIMNAHADRVLCVSDRVGEVAHRFGIDSRLLQTCYIGTAQAEKFHQTAPRGRLLKEDGSLTLAYLGYMRRDKGFFFLLDALEGLGRRTAERIDLVICARRADPATMARVEALGGRFRSVFYADGYRHEELDDLLAPVDLGVIPSLWEDNLPQTAIELHARHIPILTSELGGAQELGNFPPMVFKAGDVEGFQEKLEDILDEEITAEGYWDDAMAPVSMPAHVDELLAVYARVLADDPHADAATVPETRRA